MSSEKNIHQLVQKLVNSSDYEKSIPNAPVETLPMLSKYRRKKHSNLKSMQALFVQHHLAPFVARVNSMYDDGLDQMKSWFVDIPYSTNSKVRDQIYNNLKKENFLDEYRNPFKDYNTAQLKRVKYILKNILGQQQGKGVLIIDDGAYVLKQLASLPKSSEILKYFRNAKIIEQTTRGHRFLESDKGHQIIHDLGIVAVSVARSMTKVVFESPSIGLSIAYAVKRRIESLKAEISRVLIIGFGSVGAATANVLKVKNPRLQIDIVDSNRDQIGRASRKFRTFSSIQLLEKNKETYDLIIGCTGGTSFTRNNFNLLSNVAFLASGSSAAVEFDRAELFREADRDTEDDFEVLNDRKVDRNNIHTDIHFKYGKNKRFTILNSGWPINFDSRPEHLSTVLISPTHCLLYSAVIQAMSHTSPGLRLLDPAEDYWIFKEAKKNLIRSIEDL